ncbi:MAG: signal peptidase I [Clostridia bacterium]|nr:signal peptidase I [Clostridia bacterium]MBQ6707769.1 signal peptidase I [Clostridia bacterium]
MAKKIKLINDIATTVISIFFLFVIAVSLIPKLFGLSGFYVETDSMAPTFSEGSLVFTEQVEFSEIRVGDMLTFESKDTTRRFTHRVYKLDNNEQLIYTKGDANDTRDPVPTPYEFVRGRVRLIIPYMGFVVEALNSTVGRIITAVLIVIWIAVEIELFRIRRKELSKTDEEKNN